MLLYIYGVDTFRSRQYLRRMIEKFKVDRDPQGLNVVSLDCTKMGNADVLEQMLATPFLAERRMVVLENVLSATGKKDLQEEIFARLKEKRFPETNVLVFWESEGKPKTDVSKKLHELLSKEKFAQEFKELKGAELSSWIRAQMEERGGSMEPQAVSYLVANIGGDMWRLSSLLDQLIAYKQTLSPLEGGKGGVVIMISDIQLFLDEKTDDNIFNLVDAIVAKQPKTVFRMIRQQYTKGEDAQYVFAMIIRQFRILLELRDMYEHDDGAHSDQFAKALGLHPFVVKKSLPFVKRYTLAQLKKVYDRLLEFDIKTKTGQGSQPVLLDVFVGELCA